MESPRSSWFCQQQVLQQVPLQLWQQQLLIPNKAAALDGLGHGSQDCVFTASEKGAAFVACPHLRAALRVILPCHSPQAQAVWVALQKLQSDGQPLPVKVARIEQVCARGNQQIQQADYSNRRLARGTEQW